MKLDISCTNKVVNVKYHSTVTKNFYIFILNIRKFNMSK